MDERKTENYNEIQRQGLIDESVQKLRESMPSGIPTVPNQYDLRRQSMPIFPPQSQQIKSNLLNQII